MSFGELWVFCEDLTQNLFRPAIFLRINQSLPKSLQEMRLRIELCAAFEQFARLIGMAQLPPQFRQAQESPRVGLFANILSSMVAI
jgi:hypothetical protein